MVNNHHDQLIIQSLVQLAHGMGKRTIAEYTTNADTFAFLRSAGVDCAQGFHIGRPTPIATAFPALTPVPAPMH